MSDDVKLCRECKWCVAHSNVDGFDFGECLHKETQFIWTDDCRKDGGDCGPSGKYWEPKK